MAARGRYPVDALRNAKEPKDGPERAPMLSNANVLSAILLVIAVLFVVAWFVFGSISAFYFGLVLTPIAMIIMVAMLWTFPKDKTDG